MTRATKSAWVIFFLVATATAWYYVYVAVYLPSELRVAATNGDLARVKEILKWGVNVNEPLGSTGNSVLSRAIEGNNSSVVAAILQAGADPNAMSDAGMTPLHFAAFFGDASIVALLVKHGARVDAVEPRHKNTPLLTAVRKGHVDVVKVLLTAGADPNQGRAWGDAPLCRAQALGRPDIADLLKAAGAVCP